MIQSRLKVELHKFKKRISRTEKKKMHTLIKPLFVKNDVENSKAKISLILEAKKITLTVCKTFFN